MVQTPDTETPDPVYQSLYRIGGVAALIVAGLTLGEIVFFVFYPQPTTVIGWFELFQKNKILGLLDFWGLEILMYIMFVLVFLALYFLLRKTSQTLMAIALTFALIGIGIFFATNNPFSMLTLSNHHAAATTDAQRATFLAAGQALLANTNQRAVGGFNMGLLLVYSAGLILSSAMLRSNYFSKPMAYVGIIGFALSLADYLREALTSSVLVALVFILPSALLLVVWFALVGRRLYKIGTL